MMIAERVRTDLHASRIPVGEGHLCRWAQAMTDYSAGSQAGPVLSRLDFGLMRAESAGNDQVVILGATDTNRRRKPANRLGSRPSSRRWRKTATSWPPRH